MLNVKFGKSIRRNTAKLISVTAFGRVLLRKYRIVKDRLFGDRKQIFTRISEVNLWGSTESISGVGSTLAQTEAVRTKLPHLLRRLGIKSVLDAPCGDFHWFNQIRRDVEVSYVGADIVEAIVSKNEENYGDSQTHFTCIDIVTDPLPGADLWICRDCLFHLPNRDICLVLSNFMNSRIPYLLTSTHPDTETNIDIPTGSFRMLNLLRHPFNLPKPELLIEDWAIGRPRKQLGLWTRHAMEEHMSGNYEFWRLIAPAHHWRVN